MIRFVYSKRPGVIPSVSNSNKRRVLPFVVLIGLSILSMNAYAVPFTEGNLLVTQNNTLHEYTVDGTLIQSIPVPHPEFSSSYTIGDVVLDRFGRAHLVNDLGSNQSYLSTYDPVAEEWTHTSADVGSSSTLDRDLSIWGDYIFHKGVRMDVATFDVMEFDIDLRSVSEVSVGHDGFLYAVNSGSPEYYGHRIDPITLEKVGPAYYLRDVEGDRLDVPGITANAEGDIFALNDKYGNFTRLDSDANHLDYLYSGDRFWNDLTLRDDGLLVAGGAEGDIAITDTEFSFLTTLSLGGDYPDRVYVGFVDAPSGPDDLDPSNASFSVVADVDVLNLDFGRVVIGKSAADISFEMANLRAADPSLFLYRENVTGSGDADVFATDFYMPVGLLPGDSQTFAATIDTSTLGTFNASYEFTFTDNVGTDQILVLNLNGEVSLPDFSSVASFDAVAYQDVLNIDFGSFFAGETSQRQYFDVSNLLSSGTTADLDLISVVGSGDTTAFFSDLDEFEALLGGDSHSYWSFFRGYEPGEYAATYDLTFTDILGVEQTLTLNLAGEIVIEDDPTIPDLVYNAATGEVILDPDASVISGYVFNNESSAFLPGGHTQILNGVITSLDYELAEIAFAGITTPQSIGNVFPAGMDITELYQLLSINKVSRGFSTPEVPFDLIVIGDSPAVPEPSTYVLGAVGLVGLVPLGRRKGRAARQTNQALQRRCQAARSVAPGVAVFLGLALAMLVAGPASEAGLIVVGHDVNTLSTSKASSGGPEETFALNVADYLTGGTPGSLLLLEANPSAQNADYSSVVENALAAAGYAVTVTPDFTTPLAGFDAVFVAASSGSGNPGGMFLDNLDMIQYVGNGGGIYLASGVLPNGSSAIEAAGWEAFMDAAGLEFETADYNHFQSLPVTSTHPLFTGITGQTFGTQNGQSMTLSAAHPNPSAQIIETHLGEGVYAVSEIGPPVPITEPSIASFSENSNVDTVTIDWGTVSLGGTATTETFLIANRLLPGNDFSATARLDLISVNGAGDTGTLTTDLAIFDNLFAGESLNFEAMLDTSLPGVFDARYALHFTDDLGTEQTLRINLAGEIVIEDDPSIPNLVYNAATGEVILDPDASVISGYVFNNNESAFLPGGHTPILNGVTTSLNYELAEIDFAGITSPASIGNVFPAGMDITELYQLLSINKVSRGFSTPEVPFDLIVIGDSPAVPEPSTYVLGAVGLVGLALLGRRRKRASKS